MTEPTKERNPEDAREDSAKEEIMRKVCQRVMEQPTEADQNVAALLVKTFAQGVETGEKAAAAKLKTA